jgi:hypothetical protein
MKQAIFGVTPAETKEGTIMVVFPSIAAYGLGRWMGKLLAIRWPDKAFLRLGVLLAPALIPFGLALYFYRLAPSFLGIPIHGKFYKLTNRRVLELRNEINFQKDEGGRARLRFLYGVETKWVPLDRFDSIEVLRRPGQEWYDAGDLVFREGTTETFRLEGVSRPEGFRHNCLKAHYAYVGVKQARARESVKS